MTQFCSTIHHEPTRKVKVINGESKVFVYQLNNPMKIVQLDLANALAQKGFIVFMSAKHEHCLMANRKASDGTECYVEVLCTDGTTHVWMTKGPFSLHLLTGAELDTVEQIAEMPERFASYREAFPAIAYTKGGHSGLHDMNKRPLLFDDLVFDFKDYYTLWFQLSDQEGVEDDIFLISCTYGYIHHVTQEVLDKFVYIGRAEDHQDLIECD